MLNITRKVLKFKRDNQKPSFKGHNNTVVKRKRTKGQTMGHKTLHINLKIEQHELHETPRVNSTQTPLVGSSCYSY